MKYILLYFFLNFIHPSTPTYEFAKQTLDNFQTIRQDYIILINYSKPMSEERLYVFNMESKEIILTSKVSHAFKSGIKIPTEFSNELNSKKSSKGAFMTLNSYYGTWGYSMKLKGLEKGLNDNAEKRYIIFHACITDDVNFSDGCFMTTKKVNKKIIDLTKNGCLVFVY